MTYPQSTEYHSAVQSPELCFLDPELRSGTVRSTPLGLPHALSGGFALTYTVQNGAKKFAVRCFHREVPDLQRRYEIISKRLKALNSKFFVDFNYQNQGIKVNNLKFPIVKMTWVEGVTLGDYITKNSRDKAKLTALRNQFRELNDFMANENIAHGDIQDLNVIVSNDRIFLIDYDGMYVDGLPVGSGNEIGHKDFQHPLRSSKEFGPKMDRFSLILLDLALSALIEHPALMGKFRSGGEAILFKANDFKDPGNSSIFSELLQIPALSAATVNFRAICQARVEEIPSLRDFLAGNAIPVSIQGGISRAVSRPAVLGYISSYSVLDASSYAAVANEVGQKVELIGKIVDVKHGVGKRGRGKGRPYVFINFGNWQQDCVKLTIWSEALDNFTTAPSASLVGKWVSVIGLIDPPYEGSHYGKAYRNIGITIDRESQIERISESDAKYRLAGPKTTMSATQAQSSNRDLLNGISGRQIAPKPVPSVQPSSPTVTVPTGTSNKAILAGLQAQTKATVAPPSLSPRPNPPPKPTPAPAPGQAPQSNSSNAWLYWLIGGALLFFLFIAG